MISISLCMIVKDEEKVLERCLNSIAGIVDEIIIVDTGSSDHTKEIALKYTSQVFDYKWQDDFSKARNFAFSKATKDYIYSADADEVIDEENQARFLQLKQVLLDEIEIVQMIYVTDMQYNTTENFVKDIRPKLYKRLRHFVWKDPIHEMVELDPVVYNSDIEIMHKPISFHQKRDFHIFYKQIERGGISERLLKMLTRELYLVGTKEDILEIKKYLSDTYYHYVAEHQENNEIAKMIAAVLCKIAVITVDKELLFDIALVDMSVGSSAEVCMQLGNYYFSRNNYEYALKWYECAAFSAESILDIHSSNDHALLALAETLEKFNNSEQLTIAKEYRKMAKEWQDSNESNQAIT